MQQSSVAQNLVIGSFSSEGGGKSALQKLEQLRKDGTIDFKDAAVLKRDADNKLHVSETADKGMGKGGAIGGVAGAAVGIIAGPIGWAALGGAAVGGLMAKLKDGGFKDDRLKKFGESIPAGSSAMLAVVDHAYEDQVEEMLKTAGADVTVETIPRGIAEALDEEAARLQES